ncbi:hypothetical protein OAO55_01860 [Bacteroidales bacterium]|nr:hypothetical protein [Bacteroidales bacterium]
MRKIFLIGLVIFAFLSCEKDNKTSSDSIDTLELKVGNYYSSIEQSTICFDTILTDSRCANGANCIWEGNATIILNLTTKESENYKIELNTNPDFPIDTTIGNIYVLLTGLTPYPEIGQAISPEDYISKLTIANIDKLKSNAKIIDFTRTKCGCCWGWTIKIGNDTIKSDNELIGKTIGYSIGYPVNVYIEKGDLERTCSEFDYYKILQIIKVE